MDTFTSELVAASAGMHPVIEQTGGNCWAITYHAEHGVVAVTVDPNAYYVAAYRDDAWYDGGDYYAEAECDDVTGTVRFIERHVAHLGGQR